MRGIGSKFLGGARGWGRLSSALHTKVSTLYSTTLSEVALVASSTMNNLQEGYALSLWACH